MARNHGRYSQFYGAVCDMNWDVVTLMGDWRVICDERGRLGLWQ